MKPIYLILLMFVSTFAHAEEGYWVCIASFRDQDVADQYRMATVHEFPDELRVAVADTSVGRYFRVLVGPYETALRANEALDDVRRERPDAWLITSGPSLVVSDLGLSSSGSASIDVDEPADLEASDRPLTGYRYRGTDESPVDWEYEAPVVQDAGADHEVTSSNTEKLNEIAPPGYNVHRLNPGAGRTDD